MYMYMQVHMYAHLHCSYTHVTCYLGNKCGLILILISLISIIINT